MNPDVAISIANQANARILRKELHPAQVLTHFGHSPEIIGRLRLSYLSPFRDDTNPSLDVFRSRSHEWRVGDFAEGWQGSSIDLIQRFEPAWSNDQAIDLARVLYANQLASGVDYDTNAAMNQREFRWPNPNHDNRAANVWHYYYSQNHPCLPPVGYLRTHFDIHVMANEMVWVPYYDIDNQIIGYKTLSRSGGKRAGVGSKMALYANRYTLSRLKYSNDPVIICEGESDTWVMDYLYGEEYVVVGFPGANQNVQELLGVYENSVWTNRYIAIVFDGDAAGTSGRAQVAQWLYDHGATVTLTPLPDNKDVADMQEQEIRDVFDEWQMPFGEPQKIIQVGNCYRRLTSDGSHGTEITNWAIDIDRFLIGEDNESWAIEGSLLPTGRKVTLTSTEFRSVQKLIDWSQRNTRQFFGNTTDAQKLGSYLLDQATMKPVGRMTTRAGLHRGDFVWPDGCIGDQEWRYIEKESGLMLGSTNSLTLPAGKTNHQIAKCIENLYLLHKPEVTMPAMAWMAVAPLRTLLKEFPILHLSGTSGSGKTTLTSIMTIMMTGSMITSNLTTTTPYAISAHFMASNAFPIWFDEYRPGARDDAKKTLDQLLRDTYTGQISTKGSMNRNRAEVTQILTDVPVVITGEDTLSEKSHVDRCIIINIPMEGKNSSAKDFFEWESSYAHQYLQWLHANDLTHGIDLPSINIGDDLAPRQKHNLSVLQYGYNLLKDYVNYLDTGWELPPPNWDLILHDAHVAADENPIIELIRWAYESNERAVVAHEDSIAISTVELMRIQNAPWGPRLPIPFEKHTAFGRWLEDHMGAKKERIFNEGKQKRVYLVSYEDVMGEE